MAEPTTDQLSSPSGVPLVEFAATDPLGDPR